MNKKQKFISGGILLSLVGLAMRGVSLALGAYISRSVGAEGVGLNALVMNAYAFALTFSTAGWTTWKIGSSVPAVSMPVTMPMNMRSQ